MADLSPHQDPFRWRILESELKIKIVKSPAHKCLALAQFHSFVVNGLLDDGAFRIEWRKNFVDENHNLVWLPGGMCKTVLTDKDDPAAQPVVVWDNDGTQNVKLLMEAMDHKEWEVKRREEQEKKIREMFSKFRK